MLYNTHQAIYVYDAPSITKKVAKPKFHLSNFRRCTHAGVESNFAQITSFIYIKSEMYYTAIIPMILSARAKNHFGPFWFFFFFLLFCRRFHIIRIYDTLSR